MDSAARHLVTKRVCDEPADDDGFRVLVDRLWPRGISKERARLDLWLMAPRTRRSTTPVCFWSSCGARVLP